MDKKVLNILNLINTGGDWMTPFIAAWDCIKNLTDLEAIRMALAPAGGISQNLTNPLINGYAIEKFLSAYGAGTAYSLTNTAAAIDFGTTDPAIVIDAPGSYLIDAGVHLSRNGATVTTQTATIKVRRTNNTASDLSAAPVIDLPASTTLTDTLGFFRIPPFVYNTSASDDAVSIFASVSAGLGAGTLDATAIGTYITAKRLA